MVEGENSLKISPPLTVWDGQCFEDILTNDDSINEQIDYKDAYRTAPATQGLLKSMNGEHAQTNGPKGKFRASLSRPWIDTGVELSNLSLSFQCYNLP